MNIKELIKQENTRLLNNYYNTNEYLKIYNVDISSYWIEYNQLICITSINSNYHILIINNRVKLYYDNIKLYDSNISTPLKKYKIIMYLINKYLKNEVVYE
jgi:hypothetical protein